MSSYLFFFFERNYKSRFLCEKIFHVIFQMWAPKFEILSLRAAPELWLEKPTVEGGVLWLAQVSFRVTQRLGEAQRSTQPCGAHGDSGRWLWGQEDVLLELCNSQGPRGLQKADAEFLPISVWVVFI